MSLREWSAKKFAAKVRRLLGADSRPYLRTSTSQRSANRSRLAVEGLEDRTVPALIEFDYTLNGALQHGHIGYNDGDINPALASQTVAITDLYLTDGQFITFTEAHVAGGGVILSHGAYSGMDFWVIAGGSLHFYGSTTSFDVGWTPSSLIYDDVAITILDPKVAVTATANATEGGSNGTFHFTRTGDPSQPLTVNYTVGGTATSGTDYTALSGTVTFAAYSSTANVTVSLLSDTDSELTETVEVTIDPDAAYTIGEEDAATVNILDNDAQVVSVKEKFGAFEDGLAGKFQFTRTGDLSGSLTVNYTLSDGTATSGTDYIASSGTVTFLAGEATANVTVTALDDNDYDPNETVIATVDAGTGYSVGVENEAELTIRDSIAMTFTLDGYTVAVKYEIPWDQVDPEEATQSLTPTLFSLKVAGQNFVYGVANYTTAPTLLFEYGDLVGVEFALNLVNTGSPFSSISVFQGWATGIIGLAQFTSPVQNTKPGSMILDFSTITISNDPNKVPYNLIITVEAGVPTADTKTITVEVTAATTATNVRDAIEAELKSAGFGATAKDATSLVIQGTAKNSLKNVRVKVKSGYGYPTMKVRTEGDEGLPLYHKE